MKERQLTGLEPWEIRALQDDHKRGMTIDTIAAVHHISRRSVYRYLDVRVERVFVDGWCAWFALGSEKKAPQRLTVWEAA